eukprot:12426566-Alexandrium_andersonii.AAC.1
MAHRVRVPRPHLVSKMLGGEESQALRPRIWRRQGVLLAWPAGGGAQPRYVERLDWLGPLSEVEGLEP